MVLRQRCDGGREDKLIVDCCVCFSIPPLHSLLLHHLYIVLFDLS